MSELSIDFKFLFKLFIYVFVPLIVIILLSRVIIAICTRKTKKDNIDKYYSIMNYWTSFVAIIITIVLFAVSVMYVFCFISMMRSKGLIETNKIMYYLIMVVPVIPFSFLIYYIVGLIHIGRENDEIEQEEITKKNQEFPDTNKLNSNEQIISNNQSFENKINQTNNTTTQNSEEIEVL